jgi:2-polyprenyl-3-methyl-5-hydroxy-6-metoxy-1,4-benzoquinol methylase
MPERNIYDDADFFAGYEALRRTRSGLNEVLEQPALLRLLPARFDGLRVLDLGCGFGDFARHVRAQGALSVLGIDVSARMLAAAGRTADPRIAYRQARIQDLAPAEGPFDLAVSSLAFHYIEDYAAVLRRVAQVLRPGGLLAFSVEHPMMTALPEQSWQRDAEGKALCWPIDRYAEEGERHTHWFVDGVVKYHRTIETYVAGLIGAGFRLSALAEPAPDSAAIALRPDLADQRRRPPFLLLAGLREG